MLYGFTGYENAYSKTVGHIKDIQKDLSTDDISDYNFIYTYNYNLTEASFQSNSITLVCYGDFFNSDSSIYQIGELITVYYKNCHTSTVFEKDYTISKYEYIWIASGGVYLALFSICIIFYSYLVKRCRLRTSLENRYVVQSLEGYRERDYHHQPTSTPSYGLNSSYYNTIIQ